VATGKALPYALALCQFGGIERTVVAENGGVAFVGETDDLLVAGDPPAEAVAGGDVGVACRLGGRGVALPVSPGRCIRPVTARRPE
jgi:hypothetical protein